MPNRKKVEVRILTVKAALKQLKEKSRGEYVFSNPEDSPYKSIRSAFKTACKHAKFPRVTPQTLRHTFASRLAMAGVDLRTNQELAERRELICYKDTLI